MICLRKYLVENLINSKDVLIFKLTRKDKKILNFGGSGAAEFSLFFSFQCFKGPLTFLLLFICNSFQYKN